MSEEFPITTFSVLPAKRTVIFPETMIPLTIGRPSSIAAVQSAMETEDKELFITAQRDSEQLNPTLEDLYQIGTKAVIKQMGKTSEGHLHVLIQGIERFVLLKLEQHDPFLLARVRRFPLEADPGPEVEALHRALLDLVAQLPELIASQGFSEVVAALRADHNPLSIAYKMTPLLNLTTERLQALLELPTQLEFPRQVYAALSHELQILKLRNEIATQAQAEIGKSQREYFLRQQLKEIQQELDEEDSEGSEVGYLKQRIEDADLPDHVRTEAVREVKRLAKLSPVAPDHQVIRSYLELLLELPWSHTTPDSLDLPNVREVLDKDHYGIQDVKERILEHLAVLKLNPSAKAPILCLVGQPGVGKTSLGQSIARALGQKFERISFGGLHDEAELRGHRRTYIGAMPGRIIQALRRAGSNNPVLMFDEVDKIGRDFKGDPSSALLEILDPSQNHTFRDNYLDVLFDLSRVLFITTANGLDSISRPLLDRMEVIHLPGYTLFEKQAIADRYLWPRRLQEAGLTSQHISLGEGVLRHIISRFTREAAVRQLEQMLGSLTRKVALKLAEQSSLESQHPLIIQENEVIEWLGTERFIPEEKRKELPIGVATGLAWTETGGDVLYVESSLLPGGNDLTLTGQLSDVMQESAQAARSYLWARVERMGLNTHLFKKNGIHIHIPEGAIPKDGPSAGVTIVAALASTLLGRKVRQDTAMTGEISLSGLVLPVGGIKEKVLAAHRRGIIRILLPKGNKKDLKEIPEEVRHELSFIFAETLDEVLVAALVGQESQPFPWLEPKPTTHEALCRN